MGKHGSSGWLTDSVGHRAVGLSQNQTGTDRTGTVKEARCTQGAVCGSGEDSQVGRDGARSASIWTGDRWTGDR